MLDLLSFRYSVHRTLRLQIQRLNDQVNWKELVEPSRLSSDWLKSCMEYSMETVIKRAFHVQIGSRMILRSKKKNKISTNYSLRSLLPIQFHERNSWTECTFFFFSSQLWSTGARLSKSPFLNTCTVRPTFLFSL